MKRPLASRATNKKSREQKKEEKGEIFSKYHVAHFPIHLRVISEKPFFTSNSSFKRFPCEIRLEFILESFWIHFFPSFKNSLPPKRFLGEGRLFRGTLKSSEKGSLIVKICQCLKRVDLEGGSSNQSTVNIFLCHQFFNIRWFNRTAVLNDRRFGDLRREKRA